MVVDSDFQKSVTVKIKGSSFVTFQGGEISHGLKVPYSLGKSGIWTILVFWRGFQRISTGCWALQKDGPLGTIFMILEFQLFSGEPSLKLARKHQNKPWHLQPFCTTCIQDFVISFFRLFWYRVRVKCWISGISDIENRKTFQDGGRFWFSKIGYGKDQGQ